MTPVLIVDNMMFSLVKKNAESTLYSSFYQAESKYI